ncbi:MAG: sigma 54-interacting transcriptional regulator, partial [Candidatus Binatia bacterium]
GTIFLDEIGDLPPDLQAKLLRVLQEREFQRVGGVKDVRIDVRVIAATNRDLRAAVADGRFREDLFYRLNVVTLTIPPLRERRGDIPELVEWFLARYGREMARTGLHVSDEVMAWLSAQDWPGNVRQLQNAVERAVVLAATGALTEHDFAANPSPRRASAERSRAPEEILDESLPLPKAVDAFTVSRIRRALDRARGDSARAAELLGVPPANLSRLMKSYRLGK